ncbi:AAA family ATPase [Thiothrix subterranea]|uniref:AAA family ATPase n=1 Tax=Thiothrix subterranea TaxID=2735563 RepID=UPI00280BBD4D|nr:AAA family ATPase [Thiothrix subterranea]
MIITAINAENFRKYSHLQLENLPERGLIALTGGNESGKSSIGDIIQFGLFGRTEQVKPEDAAKLIHWRASQANVALRLQHRGHEYRLIRSVDTDGNVAATLFSTEEEVTLADTQKLSSAKSKRYSATITAHFPKPFTGGNRAAIPRKVIVTTCVPLPDSKNTPPSAINWNANKRNASTPSKKWKVAANIHYVPSTPCILMIRNCHASTPSSPI